MNMTAARRKNWKNSCPKRYIFLDALKEEEVENSMKMYNDKQVTQNNTVAIFTLRLQKRSSVNQMFCKQDKGRNKGCNAKGSIIMRPVFWLKIRSEFRL